MRLCHQKACPFVKEIKGYQSMSIDALANEIKPRCGLCREARRKAIKAFKANEKKLLKSLKIGMKQANEGKVVERDFSEFAPKAKVVKAKPYFSIDQEVAHMRKKGMAGSRDELRKRVKANRARR